MRQHYRNRHGNPGDDVKAIPFTPASKKFMEKRNRRPEKESNCRRLGKRWLKKVGKRKEIKKKDWKVQERTKEHKSGIICGPVYGCRDAHASRRAFSNVAIVINNNTVLLLLLLVSQHETWRRTKRSWCLLHLIWCSNHKGYGCMTSIGLENS